MTPNTPSRHIVGHLLAGLACIAVAVPCLSAAAQLGALASSQVDRASASNPKQLPQETKSPLLSGSGQERSIIIVGGKPGGTVALNPQPLPPKSANASMTHAKAGAVELNPQPLPPKSKQQMRGHANSSAEQRGIIIVSGKNGGAGVMPGSLSGTAQKGAQ